jgi:hypothetical protein
MVASTGWRALMRIHDSSHQFNWWLSAKPLMHSFVLLLDLFLACYVLLILHRHHLKFSNREDAAFQV